MRRQISRSRAVSVVFCGDEGLLKGFEGVVGVAAEGGFVEHMASVRQQLDCVREAQSPELLYSAKKSRPMKDGPMS